MNQFNALSNTVQYCDQQQEMRMKNFKIRRRALKLVVGLAAIVALAFPISGSQAIADDGEIVIGAPISLTGPLAGDGKEQLWAYEQAIADVNAKGGLKIDGKNVPVRLVVADDESAEGKVASAMENLIKAKKVDILLSTHSGR